MRITTRSRDDSMIIEAIRQARASEAARTGLHCSTIVKDIAEGLQPPRDNLDESVGIAFQEIGNVIEDIIADQLVQRFPEWTKPTPRTHRGVICSPDGWSPRARCIDEVKVTWKGMRDFLTLDDRGHVLGESLKFVQYKMQILFYMQAWKADRARLHVLFLNGTYRPPFPEPVTYLLRPTTTERVANEEMMIQHAQDRGWLERRSNATHTLR